MKVRNQLQNKQTVAIPKQIKNTMSNILHPSDETKIINNNNNNNDIESADRIEKRKKII